MKSIKPEKVDLKVGHYVCSLLDVMGQGKLLESSDSDFDFDNLASLEKTSKSTVSIFECWKSISNLRMALRENIDRWAPTFDDSDLILDADLKAALQETASRTTIEAFSDTVITYSNLDKSSTKVPVSDIWRIITSVMFCQLLCLANKTPLRGAIDLGLGFPLFDGNFYGPLLNRLHHFESKNADYPRVIVGPRLHKFINVVAESGLQGEYSVLNQSMALNLRRCLVPDIDGYVILDFAGHANFEWIKGDTWDAAALFNAAKKFTESQFSMFYRLKDANLATKYLVLDKYLETRGRVWTKPS